MAQRLIIIMVMALLASCSPSIHVERWDRHRDQTNCLEPHPNGLWEEMNVCRDGRGFLVWAVWTY